MYVHKRWLVLDPALSANEGMLSFV